jgi:putative FmdB family regulatory protein
MPIYEYVCLDCKNRFDALRSMSDADAPIKCQKCQSEHTSRMLSVFYAQSGGRVVAGNGAAACASCSGGTCATCGH